jgi:hypothetical protein
MDFSPRLSVSTNLRNAAVICENIRCIEDAKPFSVDRGGALHRGEVDGALAPLKPMHFQCIVV